MKRLALILVALAGCPSYAKYEPTTVTAPPDAFDRATRALIERGDTIETSDKSAGIIATKWEESTSMGTVRRVRWNVTIANGQATIVSQCQFHITSDASKWDDCGDSQPAERTDQAKQLAAKIGGK